MSEPVQAVVLAGIRRLESRVIDAPTGHGLDDGWLDVEACGICGADWNWYTGRGHSIDSPIILGHEIVGRIRSISDSLGERLGVVSGQRVVLEEAITCHNCAMCLAGRHRLCRQRRRYGGTALSSAPGLWGGYAERVYLDPGVTVHPVPPGLDASLATWFIPLSNGISWMHRSAEMRPGDAVVVQGVGQHGIGCVIAARRTGAGAVIAVGANGDDDRLKTALQCGATATINADAEDPTAAVLDLTAGRGADVVIDATPSVNAASAAISMAGVGARIVYAGTKAGAATALDTDSIYQKELVIRGVSARESWAIPEALRWLAADPELFRPIFSVEVSLDDLEDGLRALGGEGSAERPLHAIVVPRPSQE